MKILLLITERIKLWGKRFYKPLILLPKQLIWAIIWIPSDQRTAHSSQLFRPIISIVSKPCRYGDCPEARGWDGDRRVSQSNGHQQQREQWGELDNDDYFLDDFGWTSAVRYATLCLFRLRATLMIVKLGALLDCCLRAMLMTRSYLRWAWLVVNLVMIPNVF